MASYRQVGGKVVSYREIALALSLAMEWGSPAEMIVDEGTAWG